MKAKFAKALAENITTIAGNVAHVALIDAGAVNQNIVRPLRADAVAKVEECKRNIASLLQQPGCWQSDEPGQGTGREWTESEKSFALLFLQGLAKSMPYGLLFQAGDDCTLSLLAAQVNAEHRQGGWCQCVPGTDGKPADVYYNSGIAHGWMCPVCRRTTQTG